MAPRLISAVRRCPSITLLEGVEARRLIVEDNAIKGRAFRSKRAWGALILKYRTWSVVAHRRGIGGTVSRQQPIRLAVSAQGPCAGGSRRAQHSSDLEFVQFHPTAFRRAVRRPMALVTEAVRGGDWAPS